MSAPALAVAPRVVPDPEEMRRAINALFESDDVIELRAIFQRGRKRVDAGYFDPKHRENLLTEAVRLNKAGAAVYVNLNTLDPQLLTRYANRVEEFAQATATDANITRRRWLLLDFDPVRPKDTSATDDQLAQARNAASACRNALRADGWRDPIHAQSGNGYHLLYPIDLPNDAESTELVRGVLEALALRLDTDKVKLDRAVFNAARITKLYGTVSLKGDNTPAAPWRISKLGKQIPPLVPVPADRLRALIPPKAPAARIVSNQPFDIESFLSRSGIEYTRDEHQGAMRYRLAHCPFNPDHGRGEAAVFQYSSGAFSFKCMHSRCSDRKWRDFRELVEGPREERQARASLRQVLQPHQGEVWPDPAPLPAELPVVQPFNPALLPSALRPWIEDIAERVQCPPDYPAVGAVVALASVIGRKVAVRPKARDDWQEVANLWGCIIGRPGVLKTPALDEALRPLQRLEAKARETYEAKYQAWLSSTELAKIRREAARANALRKAKDSQHIGADDLAIAEPDQEPNAQRYIVNDCSVEALGEVLRANPNGVLAYRDELVGLLKSRDREGNEGARSFFLSAWTGKEAHVFDRIGRGLNLRVDACCISMLGSIQPSVIGSYLRDAVADIGDDGLLARFQLLVWPDVSTTWRNVDRWPDTEAKRNAFAAFAALADLDPVRIGATAGEDSGLPHLRLDDAAQAHFTGWREELERRLRSDEEHPALTSHLAKYRKLVPSLALVFHLADQRTGPITEESLLRALAWAEYLETHARRAYSSVMQGDAVSARALLRKIRGGAIARTFTLRQVYNSGWTHIATQDAARKAAELLEDLDYIRSDVRQTTGRPKTVYTVNPKVFES